MYYEDETYLEGRVPDWLVQQAIGEKVLRYARNLQTEDLLAQIDQDMLGLFVETVRILDDEGLDDPECFRRVDALVRAFETRGFSIRRHDW